MLRNHHVHGAHSINRSGLDSVHPEPAFSGERNRSMIGLEGGQLRWGTLGFLDSRMSGVVKLRFR